MAPPPNGSEATAQCRGGSVPPVRAQPAQGRRSRGSATIEFISMVPFVLAAAAFVWDLRHYVSQRTDAAREMYVVAEMIANEIVNNPIQAAVDRAKEVLGRRGQRAVSVAVVTRGDRRDAAATVADPACTDDSNWCLPRVIVRWPEAADVSDAVWGDVGDCTAFPTRTATSTPLLLPAEGDHFPVDARVLPHENRSGSQEDWPSRGIRPQEWWVVVDTCLHSDPGLFGGVVMRGLAFFDVSDSAFVVHRRTTWASPQNLDDCRWC